MESTVTSVTNVRQAVPFLGVRDLAASLRFYVEGLGFELSRQWVHEGRLRWCRLELGDAALMLQEFWPDGPHANVPAEPLGVGVTICLMCRDALAIYHEATARGVAVAEPFVGNGLWVAGVTDPDGYRLDFESPTDVPEETRYSAVDG